jgi:hypothetical protein
MIIEETPVIHTTKVRESSAGWWIGAIGAILAILAVVFLVTQTSPTQQDINNAAAAGLPRPTALAPVTMTVARSTPAPAVAAGANAKPARVEQTENAMRQASNKAARSFDEIVLPPPAIPPGPPQPLRPL